MEFTRSLRRNWDFKRAYARGRSAASGLLAMYVRPNKEGGNRLGLTVGSKLGGAVVRNRVRRRMKEAYRMNEAGLASGFDVVLVARVRAVNATYWELEREFLKLCVRLGIKNPPR